MKNLFKKSIAVLIALVMLNSSFACFALDVNADAVSEHYGQFKNYVLLGDSVASGYRDETSDKDEAFNGANQETVYYRVPGSYGDVIAKSIIEDNTMTAFAAPGFRTIEIRYMLEDDFKDTDEYMFHPSQLKVVGDPGSQEHRTAFKNAVKNADLITLGVGGNDWGAYLGWVISDVLEQAELSEEYTKQIEELLKDTNIDGDVIEKLLEIANYVGALPSIVEALPKALEYGLSNFYKNWDIMIQDIYDLNPDVTLMVVGMSDNSYKGYYFSYDGVEGEKVPSSLGDLGDNEAIAGAVKVIVDFIMTVGNKPMIDGADKFGYTFVDVDGATYVDSHPDADGHVYIANKIIEALPMKNFPYTDIKHGQPHYDAVEFVYRKGIMTGTTDTTFSPNDVLTYEQLNDALNSIKGVDEKADENSMQVKVISFAFTLLGLSTGKGFSGFVKTIGLAMSVISDSNFAITRGITRAEAAEYLMTLVNI